MARGGRSGRRFVWFGVDTGAQVHIGQGFPSQGGITEAAPTIPGQSLFALVRPPAVSATGLATDFGSGAEAERSVHRRWVDTATDGTIIRIVGELLTFPENEGTGVSIGRWDAGMVLLPPEVFGPDGQVNPETVPNPSAFMQADFFMHMSGWVDSLASGAQTPFVRRVDQKARRVIEGASIPAFIAKFEGDETAQVNIGFRGRILVLRA